MPQIADITVKKADGTTDAVYSSVIPSAGDSSPAVWRNNGVGTKVNQRPELRCVATGPSTGKRATKLNFVFPITETAGGITAIIDYVTIVANVKITENASEAAIQEAVVQGLNLMASALIKDSCTAGYSPT